MNTQLAATAIAEDPKFDNNTCIVCKFSLAYVHAHLRHRNR